MFSIFSKVQKRWMRHQKFPKLFSMCQSKTDWKPSKFQYNGSLSFQEVFIFKSYLTFPMTFAGLKDITKKARVKTKPPRHQNTRHSGFTYSVVDTSDVLVFFQVSTRPVFKYLPLWPLRRDFYIQFLTHSPTQLSVLRIQECLYSAGCRSSRCTSFVPFVTIASTRFCFLFYFGWVIAILRKWNLLRLVEGPPQLT